MFNVLKTKVDSRYFDLWLHKKRVPVYKFSNFTKYTSLFSIIHKLFFPFQIKLNWLSYPNSIYLHEEVWKDIPNGEVKRNIHQLKQGTEILQNNSMTTLKNHCEKGMQRLISKGRSSRHWCADSHGGGRRTCHLSLSPPPPPPPPPPSVLLLEKEMKRWPRRESIEANSFITCFWAFRVFKFWRPCNSAGT